MFIGILKLLQAFLWTMETDILKQLCMMGSHELVQRRHLLVWGM